MPESAEQPQDRDREARAVRRLLHSFHRSGSYGLVLVMIVATYVLATTLSQWWGATILLSGQMATVWLALRTSQARRGLRRVATALASRGLAGAGRADEQVAAGQLGARAGEPLRRAQEPDQLAQIVDRLVDPGHVPEPGVRHHHRLSPALAELDRAGRVATEPAVVCEPLRCPRSPPLDADPERRTPPVTV
jgi:hypothetical protein